MNTKGKNMLVDSMEMLLNFDTEEHLWDYDVYTDKTECGTSGCAIGWSVMLLPSWKSTGMKLGASGNLIHPSGLIEGIKHHLVHILGVTGAEYSYMFLGVPIYASNGVAILPSTSSLTNVSPEDVAMAIKTVLESNNYEVSIT